MSATDDRDMCCVPGVPSTADGSMSIANHGAVLGGLDSWDLYDVTLLDAEGVMIAVEDSGRTASSTAPNSGGIAAVFDGNPKTFWAGEPSLGWVLTPRQQWLHFRPTRVPSFVVIKQAPEPEPCCLLQEPCDPQFCTSDEWSVGSVSIGYAGTETLCEVEGFGPTTCVLATDGAASTSTSASSSTSMAVGSTPTTTSSGTLDAPTATKDGPAASSTTSPGTLDVPQICNNVCFGAQRGPCVAYAFAGSYFCREKDGGGGCASDDGLDYTLCPFDLAPAPATTSTTAAGPPNSQTCPAIEISGQRGINEMINGVYDLADERVFERRAYGPNIHNLTVYFFGSEWLIGEKVRNFSYWSRCSVLLCLVTECVVACCHLLCLAGAI